MNWLATVFAQWHESNRLLYAFVTVGTIAVIGLLFGLLGSWIARKLGLDTSRLNHS